MLIWDGVFQEASSNKGIALIEQAKEKSNFAMRIETSNSTLGGEHNTPNSLLGIFIIVLKSLSSSISYDLKVCGRLLCNLKNISK